MQFVFSAFGKHNFELGSTAANNLWEFRHPERDGKGAQHKTTPANFNLATKGVNKSARFRISSVTNDTADTLFQYVCG
jgi:hypothetical protein